MEKLLEYLKNNVPLTVVLALILALLIVLIVLLAVECVRKKKAQSAAAAPNPEEAPEEVTEEAPKEAPEAAQEPQPEEVPKEVPEEAPKEVPEAAQEPQPEEAPEEVPEEAPKEVPEAAQEPQVEETPKEEEMKKTVPAEKRAPEREKEAAKAAPVAAKPSGANGKWLLFESDRGGYGFRLLASNGEEMLRSSAPYATLASAKAGIKTYQENIAAGRLEIVETKKGNFFVQINNGNNRMLATSADYKTRSGCESALESIRRWAATQVIAEEEKEE